MAELQVTVGISKMGGSDFYQIQPVVDVWADHSVFPAAVLNELGIEPTCQLTVELPDGSDSEWGYGVVMLEIGDQRWPCPVVFSPADDCILGASALQIFNLEKDYESNKLVLAGPATLGKTGGRRASEFTRPTAVAPLEGYRIWLHYPDGVSGEVDLSHLVQDEPFARWRDPQFFKSVRLGVGGTLEWGNDITLCGHALYLDLVSGADSTIGVAGDA